MKPMRYLLFILLFIATRADAVIGPILSPTRLCSGTGVWLSDTTAGGIWTSSDTAKATIDPSSGLLRAIAAGTVTITYTVKSGSYVIAPLIIDPGVAYIYGPGTFCTPGDTFTYQNAKPGGIWESSDTSILAIDSITGFAKTKNAGNVTLSYSLGLCSSSISVTIQHQYVLDGCDNIGVGDTIQINVDLGYTIMSSDPAALVYGNRVIGIHPGTAKIVIFGPYTGCLEAYKNITITSTALVRPITGNKPFCKGNSINLGDMIPGGNWKINDTTVAKITSTGVMVGIKGGWSSVTYSVPGASCISEIIVNDLPKPITGPAIMCVKDTIILSSGTGNVRVQSLVSDYTYSMGGPIFIDGPFLPSGIFSSSDTTIARVRDKYYYNDHIIGVSAGTATISYTDAYTGCYTTKPITVNGPPVLSSIKGTTSICTGTTAMLSDTITGGLWSVSDTSVAKINPATGLLSAIKTGTLAVQYSAGNSCGIATVFDTLTVISLPSAGIITGRSALCTGDTATLIDTTTTGIWSCSNTSVATVNSTGLVTAVNAGTAILSYTVTNSCGSTSAVTTITVNPIPAPISGPAIICAGFTATYSDAGTPGTWSSSNVLLAAIGSSTGIVTGLNAGTPTITFTNLVTGCYVTRSVAIINPPATLIGPATVCQYTLATFSSYPSGGTWSTGNTAIATINTGTGQLAALMPGTTTVTYTLSGTCYTTTKITVAAAPTPITGKLSVCIGGNITLSDAIPGGIWSATSTCVTLGTGGVVTGINTLPTNIATITYTLPNTCAALTTVTVVSLVPSITGITSLCVGSTKVLSDALTGGIWSASNTNISVPVPGFGNITGIAAGISTISYTVSGCSAVTMVMVNPLPAVISGLSSICAPDTTVFSDATIGGIWTSSNHSVAIITTGGMLSSSAAGTTTISYTIVGTGCASYTSVSVSTPAILTGRSTICSGDSSLLTPGTGGGTWSSSNTGIATVNSRGLISGISAGTAVISYAPGTSCGSVFITVTVMPAPGIITGITGLCMGDTATLHNAVPGGMWSSGNTSVATVTSTGNVTTISAGSAIISYTLSGSCAGFSSITSLSVNALPVIDSSSFHMCAHSVNILTGSGGRYWSISDTLIASVDRGSGIVTASTAGSAVVTFTSTSGCKSGIPIFVDSIVIPSVYIVSHDDSVCAGSTELLHAIVTNQGSAPHFQWMIDHVIAGSDSSSLVYLPGSSDTVSVMLISNATCATPGIVFAPAIVIPVIYTPIPFVKISSSGGNTITKGTIDTLSAFVADAGMAPTYQWYINQTAITGAIAALFICDSLKDNDTVNCGVTSSDRCNPEGYSGIIFHVSDHTRTANTSINSEIAIYPNPNNGIVNIKWQGQQTGSADIIIITDAAGREVHKETLKLANVNGAQQVNVHDVANGVYIIRIKSGNINYTGKLVIEK